MAGAAARRRGLGARAFDVQRRRPAVCAALGRGARAVALPDGGVRRHRGRQLAVGRRRGAREHHVLRCWRARSCCSPARCSAPGGRLRNRRISISTRCGIGRNRRPPCRSTRRTGPVVITIEYVIRRGRPAASSWRRWRSAGASAAATARGTGGCCATSPIPELWIERYETPTWLDYVRLNNRMTQNDAVVPESLRALHRGPDAPRVRRMIERPAAARPKGRCRARRAQPSPRIELAGLHFLAGRVSPDRRAGHGNLTGFTMCRR